MSLPLRLPLLWLVVCLPSVGCVEGFDFDDLVGPPIGPDACDECVQDAMRPDGSTDVEVFNQCVRDVPQCSLCLQPFFDAEDQGADGAVLEVLFCDCVTSCDDP